MPVVGLKARYLASRRRDEQQAAETYRAFPYRTWLLRTAGLVAVSAVGGAVLLPLLGTSASTGDAAWFAGVLQLSLQVSWRLLGRTAARKKAGL